MEPVTGPCGTDPRTAHERPSPLDLNLERAALENSDDTRDRWIFRRGHSDGDVLTRGMGPYRRMSTEGARGNEETWMDFMRQVPDDDEGPSERARLAMRRAGMVAADRKRHLQGAREDYSRRRSASTTLFGQSIRDRTRQQILAAGISSGLSPSFQQPTHRDNSIDMDRPLPQLPSVTNTSTRPTGDIILPRWQPDAEVSHCPICGRTFAFWYRKHHCRKCGRVVCANCSPHRITIPRQFIVHPPEDIAFGMTGGTGSSNVEVVDLTGDDEPNAGSATPTSPLERSRGLEHRLDPALGGGREVRLCNPCPLPTSSTGFDGSQSGAPTSRRHTQHSSPYPPYSPQLTSTYGSVPGTSSRHALPNPIADHLRHRSHTSTSTVPTHPRYRSMLDISTPLPPIPPPPPPPLKEEDECPICHSALPPKGPDGSETAREEHVAACIETHFSSSGPRSTNPPPEAAIAAVVAASSATPAQAAGTSSAAVDPNAGTESAAPAPASSTEPIPRRRVAGMVVYHASEKDCIGEDGEGAQECVICFEEFAVGEEMGRLECLCKFHK
ncbi:MAG: hypothetical protein Q9187_000719, partial [Circinaria calcarea]